MKIAITKTLVITGLAFGIFIIPFILLAQGLPAPILPGAPEQAPIDGGLGILAALGGAYAIKKLRDRE